MYDANYTAFLLLHHFFAVFFYYLCLKLLEKMGILRGNKKHKERTVVRGIGHFIYKLYINVFIFFVFYLIQSLLLNELTDMQEGVITFSRILKNLSKKCETCLGRLGRCPIPKNP